MIGRISIAFFILLLGAPLSCLARDVVTYEAFGAIGDGVADDLPAICKAHQHANANNLPVQSNPKATYHLGKKALTAIIATNTDWSTSKFIIDDSQDVEDHAKSLFKVQSLLKPEKITIKKLSRDQKKLPLPEPLEHDCFVLVTNSKIKRYIRRGLNQNAGTPQRDVFILRRDGTIESPIDWNYDHVSSVMARPIDKKKLVIRGGIFTTIANRMDQKVGYNYWYRNISVSRSNTEIIGLKHLVTGETNVGCPYSGFLSVSSCADVTLRDCFATGHKTYRTIGSAGRPVSMGTYDYGANSVVNFSMIGCRQDNILDRSRWGIIGTNYCKNILLEDCALSRMDAHQGVSGTYIIRRTKLGYAGLNAIGRGKLLVEDSTLQGYTFLHFRGDYGSTWEGEVVIRNCRWLPAGGGKRTLHLFSAHNDGKHNFGYPCFMPREISIDGLYVNDANHPEKYAGIYLFSDPGIKEDAPFPFHLTKKVSVKNLTTESGKGFRISSNPLLQKSVTVAE